MNTMITTAAGMRIALSCTHNNNSNHELPLFSCPQSKQSEILKSAQPKYALTDLKNSRAGFIGKDVAFLVQEIL